MIPDLLAYQLYIKKTKLQINTWASLLFCYLHELPKDAEE